MTSLRFLPLLVLLPCLRAQVQPIGNGIQPPDVVVRNVEFVNATLLTPEDQQQILAPLRQEPQRASDLVEEAAERVGSVYQNRGYFRVEVSAHAAPVADHEVDITVNIIADGLQYRLGDIHWTGTRAFSEQRLLDLTPIRPGEIFNRSAIEKGLQDSLMLYQSNGYIRFTSIPDTEIDDESATISLRIDVNEGDQFSMGKFAIQGIDEDTRTELLREFPLKPGDIFSEEAWEQFLMANWLLVPPDPPLHQVLCRTLDLTNRTVNISLDYGPAIHECRPTTEESNPSHNTLKRVVPRWR